MSLQEEREESKMAANVESMFYTRKAPWHGLGVRVEEAPESKEALIQAGDTVEASKRHRGRENSFRNEEVQTIK